MNPDRKAVVDASVAVKWYVPERASAQAVALLEGGSQLLAPDLLVPEFGNALWRKTVRGELGPREASEIMRAFLALPPLTFHPSALLLQAGMDIALEFRRTAYDALYLALAVAEDCPLITADATLLRALRGTSMREFVQPLPRTGF